MDQQSYEARWADFSRRRWSLFGLFLGFIPFGITMSSLWSALKLPQNFMIVVMVPYLAGYLFAGFRLSQFRCPRCHLHFSRREVGGPFMSYHHSFTTKCLNCGLKKDTPFAETLSLQVEQPTSSARRFNKIFDTLNLPLTYLTVVSASIAAVSSLLNDAREANSKMYFVFALVVGVDILGSLWRIVNVAEVDLKAFVRATLPKWLRLVFPGCILLSLMSQAVGVLYVWSKTSFNRAGFHRAIDHAPIQISFTFNSVLAVILALAALYAARLVQLKTGEKCD